MLFSFLTNRNELQCEGKSLAKTSTWKRPALLRESKILVQKFMGAFFMGVESHICIIYNLKIGYLQNKVMKQLFFKKRKKRRFFGKRLHHFSMFDKVDANKGIVFASGESFKVKRRLTMQILRALGVGKSAFSTGIEEEANNLLLHLDQFTGQDVYIQVRTFARKFNWHKRGLQLSAPSLWKKVFCEYSTLSEWLTKIRSTTSYKWGINQWSIAQ